MRMVTIAVDDGLMPDGRGGGHKVRSCIRAAYWQIKYTMAHHQVRHVMCTLLELVIELLHPLIRNLMTNFPKSWKLYKKK